MISPGGRLDDDSKRLLAAILEFSSLSRREEPRREPRSSRLDLGRTMQEHGLGARHASALLSVALYGPMTVTQLAGRHHVMVKTASLIAVELERAGLLERRADPTDRRCTILKIAKGSRRVIEDGVKRRAAPLQRTLDRLSRAQREGLIRGLEVLAEEMSRSPGEEASRAARGPGQVVTRLGVRRQP